MWQFLWKWATFIAAVAFSEGHMTGTGWGILALAGAGLLLVVLMGALIWLRLGGDDLNGVSLAVIVSVVIFVIVIGIVGWGWLRTVVGHHNPIPPSPALMSPRTLTTYTLH